MLSRLAECGVLETKMPACSSSLAQDDASKHTRNKAKCAVVEDERRVPGLEGKCWIWALFQGKEPNNHT